MPEKTMDDLFREAEEKGLWFVSTYEHIWFSPASLKANQAEGRFRSGPQNWALRDPVERLKELERIYKEAFIEYNTFAQGLENYYAQSR